MSSFISKTCRFLFFSAFVFWAGETRVWANHAGAVHISAQTYPIFLCIFFAIVILLVGVLFVIWRINRRIKKLNRSTEYYQSALNQRTFFILTAIMLVVGLLSVGMFYFFLQSDIAS